MSSIITIKSSDELSKYLDIKKELSVVYFGDSVEAQTEEIERIAYMPAAVKNVVVFSKNAGKLNSDRFTAAEKPKKRILNALTKNVIVLVNADSALADAENIIKRLIGYFELADQMKINHVHKFANVQTAAFIISNDTSSETFSDIAASLKAVLIKSPRKRTEFLYDLLCSRMDKEFSEKNYCQFENDTCIAARKGLTPHETFGCCYSFKYSANPRRYIKDIKLCEKLNGKECSTKCLICKLYTCDYLKKQNIVFDLKKMPLSKCFFTRKQIRIIRESFFMNREDILNKMMSS